MCPALQADLVREYLLLVFAISAHAYTRGTHIAPESTPIDRAAASPPFATPAGLTAPLFLKWLLVFEDPIAHGIWLCRALPRAWLAQGESLSVDAVPTAYGRIGYSLSSAIASHGTVHANLSLSSMMLAAPPPGGVVLRLRVPYTALGKRLMLRNATVGGRAWPRINSTDATIHFGTGQLTREIDIVATFEEV